MDSQDKKYVAEVINYFWGPNLVTPDRITDHVANAAYEALESANKCTAAMDMVPRPTYSKSGLSYIIKQLRNIGKRIASGESGIYYICKLTVTSKYEMRIKLALKGM